MRITCVAEHLNQAAGGFGAIEGVPHVGGIAHVSRITIFMASIPFSSLGIIHGDLQQLSELTTRTRGDHGRRKLDKLRSAAGRNRVRSTERPT